MGQLERVLGDGTLADAVESQELVADPYPEGTAACAAYPIYLLEALAVEMLLHMCLAQNSP